MEPHTVPPFWKRLEKSNPFSQIRDFPVQLASFEEDHIDNVFLLVDKKHRGWLNSSEFKCSLTALDVDEVDSSKELENYGTRPPGWIDPCNCPVNRLVIFREQFQQCAAKLIANRDPLKEIVKVFNMFDYDRDGIISVEDMRRFVKEDNEPAITDEEIQTMIRYVDHNGKGGVNLEEFIQLVNEASELDIN